MGNMPPQLPSGRPERETYLTTLRDISRELGISVTQVSRALNGHSDVNEDTRQRVLEAAQSLNYHPNISARKLVSGKSGIVGLVLRQSAISARGSDFIEIVGGLSQAFSRLRMQFMLHIAEEGEDIVEVYRRLTYSGAIDGFVVVEPRVKDRRIAFLKQQQVPFVVHGRTEEAPDYPYFDIDNFDVARRMTQYLIDKGHQRIALVNGRAEWTYASWRTQGYQDALARAGISFDPRLVTGGQMTEQLGLVSAIEMLRWSKRRPTAFIAGNILIAKGIYGAVRALGLSIPQDVSVTGHDDQLHDMPAEAFYPGLTGTGSALNLSWEPLARFLRGRIDGAPLGDVQSLGPVTFDERGSVAERR
jgi:LacI family transcriptional regulator, galactose operon repressor